MAMIEEIDLHLEAFHPNQYGLSNEEKVQLSLNRMIKHINLALDKGVSEIKFIHGKGTGVLKERVYQELRILEVKGIIDSFEPSFFNEGVVRVFLNA